MVTLARTHIEYLHIECSVFVRLLKSFFS